MAKNLVIVESPAKAKTIKKYLPKGYEVTATMGHVIDLPKSRLGIDIENHFTPEYIKIRGKGELLKKLKKEAKKADNIYLATDPDREGEAISWHVANFLELDLDSPCRIEFHEITKRAVNNAIDNKRTVDMNIVNSQQARRLLDRLVGYSVSPFLWKKVKRGLSGGRVQSAVTRMIVDREEEIQAFVPEEYWNLDLQLKKDGNATVFTAKFHSENGKKMTIENEETAKRLEQMVLKSAIKVSQVKKRTRKQGVPLPFTTSTLQQTAYQKYGFTTQRTMRLAQQLYEGIDIKDQGRVGLITYIRTDSTRLADEAKAEAHEFILKEFGEDYLKTSARKAKKKKNIQDAHEAIRPSSIFNTPEALASSLEKDQYKLYRLIWERLLASQMSEAEYDVTDVDIITVEDAETKAATTLLFKAKGERKKFDGFTKVYSFGNRNDKNQLLPKLTAEELLQLVKIDKEQKYTKPPARFTEASLVKALEERGIGRPSTYAPTISTIKNRDYVEVQEKHFVPTELGITVTHLMKEYFADIVNLSFTAEMEQRLDKVSEGNVEWHRILEDFYTDFDRELKHAQAVAQAIKIEDPLSDEFCEVCGRQMVIKKGRYGKFLACPGFPECKNTKPYLEKTGGICPECGGDLIKKVTKKGRTFYACSNYPQCEFSSWDLPIPEKCPKCDNTLFQKGLGKRKKQYCIKCGFEQSANQKEKEEK